MASSSSSSSSSSPLSNSLPLCAEKISPIVRSHSEHPSFPPRSGCGVKLARLTIAAATMASLPFFSADSMAMASMRSFSDVAMEVTTSDLVDYSRKPPNPNIYPNNTKSTSDIYLNNDPNPNIYSSANPRLISLALPWTYYEEMATVTVNSNHVRCPKWSRSEFEMVMPDVHGAPKASPRKGHQWEASMAMPNDHNKRNGIMIIISMPPHHNDLFLLHDHDHDHHEGEVENMETTITTPERNPNLLSRNRVWQNKVMCFTM